MKPRYRIQIHPPAPIWAANGYKYGINLSKLYGDYHGRGTGARTKEEALEIIRGMLKEWQKFDHIAGRLGDKPTPKNTEFDSFTKDITLMEIFGASRIESFFG